MRVGVSASAVHAVLAGKRPRLLLPEAVVVAVVDGADSQVLLRSGGRIVGELFPAAHSRLTVGRLLEALEERGNEVRYRAHLRAARLSGEALLAGRIPLWTRRPSPTPGSRRGRRRSRCRRRDRSPRASIRRLLPAGRAARADIVVGRRRIHPDHLSRVVFTALPAVLEIVAADELTCIEGAFRVGADRDRLRRTGVLQRLDDRYRARRGRVQEEGEIARPEIAKRNLGISQFPRALRGRLIVIVFDEERTELAPALRHRATDRARDDPLHFEAHRRVRDDRLVLRLRNLLLHFGRDADETGPTLYLVVGHIEAVLHALWELRLLAESPGLHGLRALFEDLPDDQLGVRAREPIVDLLLTVASGQIL